MKFNLVRPIVIDTETYYKEGSCSAKPRIKSGWPGGPWHYTHHRDFYCYMLSWFDPATGESGVIDDLEKMREFVRGLEGRTLVMHNALFDCAVLRWILPGFEPLNTIDTADLSIYLQAPRDLAGASKYLLGEEMSKAVRNAMSGVHYRDLTPERRQGMLAYATHDAAATGKIFQRYIDQFPDIERWVSDYTRRQNEAGVHIDANYLEEQMDKMKAVRARSITMIPWCDGSDDDVPLSPKRLAVWCREQGILPPASLAEDSEECVAWENLHGDRFPVVAAMRDFRKSNSNLKKLTRIQHSLRPDGTIPTDFLYGGAPHTLRFASRGINIQNLPRDSSFCDLRGCLVPAPDHKFIPVDLAGIEARCLPYLADDTEILAEIAALDAEALAQGKYSGGDLYQPHAVRMFNYDPSKGSLKKTDKALRHTTKTCVLGLGYGAGAGKFCMLLEQQVPDEVLDRVRHIVKGDNGEVEWEEGNPELALRLVRLYRSLNPKIQALWYSLNDDLKAACYTGQDFKMQLPSGRTITYTGLCIREVQGPTGPRPEVVGCVCRGDEPKRLYGGKLTENACQAFARDVFVHALYRLESAGYRVRFHAHDEAVCEVPENLITDDVVHNIERIMATTPDWTPGLPLAAEAAVMDRYAK